MANSQLFNLGGLQLGLNPLVQGQGQFIRLVNVDPDPVGALKKRAGYTTLLSSIGGTVSSLWDWHKGDESTFWLYAVSGGSVYSSTNGTGAWTITGNGTMTNGARVGHTVLEETMIIGDGTAVTRHTTSGTDFSNTSGAPIAAYFTNYQNRVYAGGTANSLFFSTTGTPTDWSTDSSSITIPGPGRINSVFKAADRLVVTKNSGAIFKYDGYALVDSATRLGPSSPHSVANIEDYRIYLNRYGYMGFNGAQPEIISHAIRPQVYNDLGSGIVGGTFDLAPGGAYKYQYMCAVGAVTDDFTGETVNNCIQVYNYQVDSWYNYSFGTPATAMWTYKDINLDDRFIFGDNSGQTYTFGGTALTDNGVPIEAIIEFIYHDGNPELTKDWQYYQFIFNPGCEARIQVAFGDTFTKEKKNWIGLKQAVNGVVEGKFPTGSHGKNLFVKITDNSINTRFIFYGCGLTYQPTLRR